MKSLAKNLIFGTGLLAVTSLPEGILAQTNKRGRIQLIEVLDTPKVSISRIVTKKPIETIKRNPEITRSIYKSILTLDSMVSSLQKRDTVNHIVGEDICFIWKKDGWQTELTVHTATPHASTYPAENLLYVFDFVKTKTDEKGDFIYGNKRETIRQGVSRKILVETIGGELYAYYKDYDNSRYIDVATPLSDTKVMRSDAPDFFVPEDAAKRYAYRKIGSKKLAFEVENIRLLLEQAKRDYLHYIHKDNPKESIK